MVFNFTREFVPACADIGISGFCVSHGGKKG